MWTRGLNPMRRTQLVPNKDFHSPTFWLKKESLSSAKLVLTTILLRCLEYHSNTSIANIHIHLYPPSLAGCYAQDGFGWQPPSWAHTVRIQCDTRHKLPWNTAHRSGFLSSSSSFCFCFLLLLLPPSEKKKKRQTWIRTLFTEILQKSFNHWNTDHVWKWVPVESSKLPVRRRVKKNNNNNRRTKLVSDLLWHSAGCSWPRTGHGLATEPLRPGVTQHPSAFYGHWTWCCNIGAYRLHSRAQS